MIHSFQIFKCNSKHAVFIILPSLPTQRTTLTVGVMRSKHMAHDVVNPAYCYKRYRVPHASKIKLGCGKLFTISWKMN